MNKKQIREKYLKIRQNLDLAYWLQANEIITAKVKRMIHDSHWQKIGLFLGVDQEVQTNDIIEFCLEKGIEVYLPVCDFQNKTMIFKKIQNLTQDLEKSPQLKIFQPKKECFTLINPNDLEVLFIPVVAFDQDYHRIGMGAGFYDRWLATSNFQNLKIGITQSSQFMNQKIKVENHDVKLDFCLTEKSSKFEIFK